MADLFILFTALTVFGIGVTVVDFLGIMSHFSDTGGDDSSADSMADNGADSPAVSDSTKHIVFSHHQNKQYNEKPGIRIISKIMSLLQNTAYFSMGFGPTGLFAHFTGLSRTTGLLWAGGVGIAMLVLARLFRRLVRRELDSSIKPDELLQEKGILLLPLEGDAISKAAVRQFGREMEIYVRSMNKDIKLPKGKEITVVDYDNDVYWVEPAAELDVIK